MNPQQLLKRLRERGVKLAAAGGRLRVRAPVGTVTSEMRAALVEHKRELLRLLSAVDQPSTPLSSAVFHFSDDVMVFGDICAGWTPGGWAQELRRKANRCDTYRSDIAKHYRAWARDIEERLRR